MQGQSSVWAMVTFPTLLFEYLSRWPHELKGFHSGWWERELIISSSSTIFSNPYKYIFFWSQIIPSQTCTYQDSPKDLMASSAAFLICKTFFSGTLPCQLKPCRPPWTPSPLFSVEGGHQFLSGFSLPVLQPRTFSRQDVGTTFKFTLFVSHLPGITDLCCLMPNILKTIYTYF